MSISFKFPITKADGTEFKTAKELLDQLMGETAGFYLLSAHGFWHGGLHISDDTSGYVADKHPLRNMATGEVVAYRLNQDYQTSTWGDGADAKKLEYSTSFCLIRHRYESPHKKPPPPATGAAPPPAATPADGGAAPASTAAPAASPATDQGPQNKLVFYSLYMHLLPYSGYAQQVVVQGTGAQAYAELPTIGSSAPATPPVPPLNASSPAAPAPTSPWSTPPSAIGVPSGSTLTILDETQSMIGAQPTKMLYARVDSVPAGATSTPLDPAGPSGGASLQVGEHYWFSTSGVQLTPRSGQLIRKAPIYWQSSRKATGVTLKTINARHAPSGDHVGGPIHTLPAGSTVEIQSEKLLKLGSRNQPFVEATLTTLGRGDAGSLAVGASVWISGDKAFLARDPVIPDSFDCVVIPNPAKPLEAGAAVGFLGLYETPGAGTTGKLSRQQAHIEIFTGEEQFADFFSNKAGLTEGKKYKVAGTDVMPASLTGTTFTPGTDALILPVVVDVTPALAKQDAQHKRWFPLSGIGDNGVVSGYVAESQLKDVVQYDWEKLGFRKVEEANDNADGYMDPQNVPDFFKKIYRVIDRNSDNDITPEELLAANHNPVVRDALAHIVAKHPSEWQGNSGDAKWNVLKEKDALLKNDPKRLKHEQERIDKLTWWDSIQDVTSFPVSPNIWHFNPVMFVDNLDGPSEIITMEMLAAVDPQGSEQHHRDILPYLNKYARGYDVDTPIRICHFLCQISAESGFKNGEEGLSYSAKRMREIFGCKGGPKKYDHHTDECTLGRLRDKLWSQESYYEHNPENLGNYVYSSREGNGDEASGEGYKYRGRGFIQLTGKNKYKLFNDEHNKRFPNDKKDFLTSPDLVLSDLEYGVESAFVFWSVIRNVNPVADVGAVSSVTQLVNGGQNGYAERKSAYNRLAPILNCPLLDH